MKHTLKEFTSIFHREGIMWCFIYHFAIDLLHSGWSQVLGNQVDLRGVMPRSSHHCMMDFHKILCDSLHISTSPIHVEEVVVFIDQPLHYLSPKLGRWDLVLLPHHVKKVIH